MGFRRCTFLLVCALLGAAVAVLPAVAGSETPPTIEAVNSGVYSHAWSPSEQSLGAGGVLTLKNGGPVPHGVKWVSTPATPVCQGVPVESSETKWSGTCTFATPGTYVFYCTVHGSEMTATVNVGAPGTTGPTTTSTTTTSSPQPGGIGSASPGATGQPAPAPVLSLARSQHGRRVRGSVRVPVAGAGGRLEVDLFASRAALSARAGRPVQVGRLVRTALHAGTLRFSVSLTARGRTALARHHRLALAVKVSLAPAHGTPSLASRSVVLHP